MKEKNVQHHTHWVPVVMADILAIIAVVGIVRIYANGGAAVASMNATERKQISVTVDDAQTDYTKNSIVDPYTIVGTVATQDGTVLFSSIVGAADASPAFANLLGYINYGEENSTQTRYLINNYYDELLPDLEYSAWSGFTYDACSTLTLTISTQTQEAMYEYLTEHNVEGCVFAYNYNSGEISCMVSTPGLDWSEAEKPEGSHINKVLYNTTPGSTMKLITLLLLESQGVDPSELYFTCAQSYTLKADGQTVVCTGSHGNISGITAIGKSCNCWFAQAVETLDLSEAKTTLQEMGFQVNETGDSRVSLGKIPRSNTQIQMGSTWDFDSVWALIGQGSTLVSPIDMATIAAAIATDGVAASPKLFVEDETITWNYGNKNQTLFREVQGIWEDGYEENYSSDQYSSLITSAKTGTADELSADENRTQKLLCGYSQELNTAFYIVVENYKIEDEELDITTADIANELLDCLLADYMNNRY
jgi:membrane peptidoglycan carboxypeptidase